MKQRIVALVMIIPIVLMICVFSAANVVTLAMPIPVSGIELEMNPEETLSLSAGVDTLEIRAHAMPLNASNQKLNYSSAEIPGKRPAEIEIDTAEGVIRAKRVGSLKITVSTAEGGFSASFILDVTSEKATELEITVPETMASGEKKTFTSRVYPEEAADTNVIWKSFPENVLKINALTGAAEAISAGCATVTATVKDGLKGELTASAEVTVTPAETESGLFVSAGEDLRTSGGVCTFRMEMNAGGAAPADIKRNFDPTLVTSVEISDISETLSGVWSFDVTVRLAEGATGDIPVSFWVDSPDYGEDKSITVRIRNVEAADAELVISNFSAYIQTGKYNIVNVSSDPEYAGAEFTCSSDNSSVISVTKDGSNFLLRALSAGKAQVRFAFLLDGEEIAYETREVQAVALPAERINFEINAHTYGLADRFAVANQTIWGEKNESGTNYKDGTVTFKESDYQLKFTDSSLNPTDVEFTSSDESIATVSEKGFLKIKKSGVVTVTAVLKAGALLGRDIRDTVTIQCVDGVNVSDYPQLRYATQQGKEVVLNADIDVGVKLIEKSESGAVTVLPNAAEILAEEVGEMSTTAPWDYYKNRLGYTQAPVVYYALKITNSVYGNGHLLNANNITNVKDGTGAPFAWAKFQGPRDFVSLSDSSASASVKAQDNIAFLVEGKGIEIDNVELRGATIEGGEQADWNSLNYVGTTCEVIGEAVFTNSRISTGRTVLRIFGESYNPMSNADANLVFAKKANKTKVLVESCILSHAREFIVRLGTNVRQLGDYPVGNTEHLETALKNDPTLWEQCAPKIAGYEAFNSANDRGALAAAALADPDFLALVKTELTLKNSVLYNSGLFAVGLESSFAGPALDGGRWNSWDFSEFGWKNLAATSFPTLLNLEGDCRIYDWKNLNNIDSSTLIEGAGGFNGGMLTFDIKKLIETIASRPGFGGIVASVDGETVAHGGIAMYGGGKNYCLVNDSGLTSEKFSEYKMGLGEIGSGVTNLLQYAAGREPFRFLMYDANSNFNWEKQSADISSGAAFVVPSVPAGGTE